MFLINMFYNIYFELYKENKKNILLGARPLRGSGGALRKKKFVEAPKKIKINVATKLGGLVAGPLRKKKILWLPLLIE